MIKITAKKDGFRRAGMAHPASPTLHADDAFTPEQLAAIETEPMLVVEHIASPEAEGAAPKAATRRKE